MAENSKIEWTDHTFNPWWGCQKVAPECKFCYAEALDNRFHPEGHWGPGSYRKTMSEDNWRKPYKWDAKAKAAGYPQRVFCASMADVFEDHAQVVDTRQRLWKVIEDTPHLIWLLLTKRPQNIDQMVPEAWREAWPSHVWTGYSCGHPDSVSNIIHLPLYSQNFLSCEPLLEDIVPELLNADIQSWPCNVDWIIAGGESGVQARRMKGSWAVRLRNECERWGVPFFFKQWGEYNQDGERVGKGAAGRLLYDHEYNRLPVSFTQPFV